MKKEILLASLLSLSMISCNNNKDSDSNTTSSEQTSSNIPEQSSSNAQESSSSSNSEESSSSDPIEDKVNIYDENYDNCVDLKTLNDSTAKDYFDGEYQTNTVTPETVKYVEAYKNNKKVTLPTETTDSDDVKFVYYTNNEARFVSLADGYALSIPTETRLETDFSLGAYRSKLYNETSTLTISSESSNPYNNWKTYRDEWIIEYLEAEGWYLDNGLEATRARKFEDTSILKGYSVIEYDLEILNPGMISKMFYNIAIIRGTNDIKNFILLVMKSTENRDEDFDKIVSSYSYITPIGTANNNSYLNMEVKENPNWNEETKNYYEKLQNQNYTDWAFYSGNCNDLVTNGTQEAYEEAFDYDFNIVSSYMHVSYNRTPQYFPLNAARKVAGGNGFNDLPVLQFSYQFTDNNNDLSANPSSYLSSLLYILRGYNGNEYDFTSYENTIYFALRRLGRNIKEYGNPVLFRLNNEMNTDWTSYCGMINLLDPDLFTASWRVLYRIFEELEVDNTIWIFNPIANSCPYSSWGEDLCYFPGNDYVQSLGLTYYIMNNENEASYSSFSDCYTYLYNKNNAVWNKYPWIISEFGCGSGGEVSGKLFRNEASQAKWITDMFNDLASTNRPDYCKNIKGAVWFSTNDYQGSKITNALRIDIEKQPTTVAAFKEGFALSKKIRN